MCHVNSKVNHTGTIIGFSKEMDLYPRWLCPCCIPKTPIRGLFNPVDGVEDMFIDVGAYGAPQSPRQGLRALRRVEHWATLTRAYFLKVTQ